ncbi:unnamed protein product [Cylindrotheca closterium]|uniref:RING-type domain-containing protein n=1 Tax=Cylindrotheca closterium TaxID=2856 RepID=A0AAD2G5C1_9STRA|nr:unnamed protein product [Cylindrotheca closterium]
MKRSSTKPEETSPNQSKHNKRSNYNKNTKGAKKNNKSKETIRTGKIGSFLSQKWSDELLLGNLSLSTVPTVATDDAAIANLDCIARFLADYRAMFTLHAQAQQESNNDHMSPLQPHSRTAHYIPTIQEFASTQIDRQSAGLRTNTTTQTTDGMAKIVNAHTQALEVAMDHVDSFQATRFVRVARAVDDDDNGSNTDHLVPSKQSLCQWHGILYSYSSSNKKQASQASKSQVHTTSTVARLPPPTPFRTGRVRAGSTHFCPPSEIADEFQQFRKGMINICYQWEERIFSMSSTIASLTNRLSPQHDSIYFSAGVTAMFLYGIVDIHMFSDGNGRLARIGANWMLKRTLGLPFTIVIASNPQQRREYIEAVQKVRSAVKQAQEEKQKKNHSKPKAKRPALPKTGIFEPLARLLLDRMAHAVRECQRNVEEKSRASLMEEGDRLARLARERMASGACVICLDENPNIATLCCGQAVHLNCFAEWLANHSTCVYCRKPFQSLQVQRPLPPPQRAAAAETTTYETTTDDSDEDETSTSETTTHDNDETETTTIDVDEDETSTHDTTAEDTTTFDTSVDESVTEDTTDETFDDTSDDSTTSHVHQHSERCGRCNNKAAVDCVNQMCGRCCVLVGEYQCHRHGTA